MDGKTVGSAPIANMSGKTVLVTGATNGIGLATAQALSEAGARVLLHGRSLERGQAAVATIKQTMPNADVVLLQADLASLGETRSLAEAVLSYAPRLDVLINNAGGVHDRRSETRDGYETTFGVNYLAPYYLTRLLLDRIIASAPARIINVSSDAHRGVSLNFEDLNTARSYFGGTAYSRSKLANILFARALHRRLGDTGVTVNSVHPGPVRSGFARGERGMVGIVYKIFGRFFLSPEEGAKTSIYVASAPDLASVSGAYFAKCEQVAPSHQASDDAAAERLWSITEGMLSLAPL